MSTPPAARTALLVIDVQRALFETEPPPYEAAEVVRKINALAARARGAGAPVFHIQHEDAGTLAHGSEGWQLPAPLDVQPGDGRVRKTTPDSFHRTDLGERLAAEGIVRLVVAGYASEFCVDTTVRRAAALGYPVTIAADAHTTHDKPHATGASIRAHHNATLPDITSFGVKIEAVASEDVSFESA